MPRARNVPKGDPSIVIALLASGAASAPQEAAIRQHASTHGLKVAAVIADVVIEGDPKGPLVRALVEAETKRAGVLLSATHTIARDAADAALLTRLAERAGARWTALAQDARWKTEEVEAVHRALLAHEALIFTPKIHLAREQGRAEKQGGPPPWGFKRCTETGERVVDPVERAALDEVLRRRAQGASLDQLARYLNGLKLPNRGTVYRATIRGVLARLDRERADV